MLMWSRILRDRAAVNLYKHHYSGNRSNDEDDDIQELWRGEVKEVNVYYVNTRHVGGQ